LDRVRAGDRAAFDSLVRRFWEPVMRFLWKRVSRQTAEDLAQEVFVAVYKTLRQGGGPRGNDPAIWQRYLLTSARNVVIDHWRRERLSPPAAGLSDLLGGECLPPEQGLRPAAEQAAPADPLSAEQFAAIRECMDRLDVLSRAVCWMRFVEGQSNRQIGRLLGRPEATVRAVLADALRALRRCLERKGMSPAT